VVAGWVGRRALGQHSLLTASRRYVEDGVEDAASIRFPSSAPGASASSATSRAATSTPSLAKTMPARRPSSGPRAPRRPSSPATCAAARWGRHLSVGLRLPQQFRRGSGLLRRPPRGRRRTPLGPTSFRQPPRRDTPRLPHPPRRLRRILRLGASPRTSWRGRLDISSRGMSRSVRQADGFGPVRALQRVLYRSAKQPRTRRFHAACASAIAVSSCYVERRTALAEGSTRWNLRFFVGSKTAPRLASGSRTKEAQGR
jgi:hypothetical protein